jgi:GNAT superfamily N-acetyltransferase
VFCAFNEDNPAALGFYALNLKPESNTHVDDQDSGWRDRSGFIPLVYIEYIAVQDVLQEQGIGTILFGNALDRAYQIANHVSVYGIGLRSLTSRTTKTYEKLGFGLKEKKEFPLMIMPVWTLVDLVEMMRKSAPATKDVSSQEVSDASDISLASAEG